LTSIRAQLTSLALIFTDSPSHRLSHYSNLRNLALEDWNADIIDKAAGLSLDTLHVCLGFINYNGAYEALVAIDKGEHETIKAAKVILYGYPEDMLHQGISEEDCGRFEWCDDQEFCYFALC
jgi:hypothetical protein